MKIKKAKYLLEIANRLLNENDFDIDIRLKSHKRDIEYYSSMIKNIEKKIQELREKLKTEEDEAQKESIQNQIKKLEKNKEKAEKIKDENIKEYNRLIDYIKSNHKNIIEAQNSIILSHFKFEVSNIIHNIPDKRQMKKFLKIVDYMNLSDIVEKTEKIANEKIGDIEKQKKVEEIIIEELKKSYKQYSNRKKIFVGLKLFIIIIGFFILTFIFAKLSKKTFFQFIKSTYGTLFTLFTIILLAFVLIEGYRAFFYDKKDYQILEEKIKNSDLIKNLFTDISEKVELKLENLSYYQEPN